MTKLWQVKGMDEDTVKAIKAKSKDYGCTIAELLKLTFEDSLTVTRPNNTQAWTIHGLTYGMIRDIKTAAKDMDLTVAGYIQAMIIKARQNKADKARTMQILKQAAKDIHKP